MKFSNYYNFLGYFSNGDLKNLYFLNCNQSYIVEDFIDNILNLIDVNRSDPFNFYNFNNEKLDLEKFGDCLESLPVIKSKKAILIKHLDLEKVSSPDFDKFKILLENISEDSILIFINLNTDKKANLRYKQIIKIFERIGHFIDVNLNDKEYIYSVLKKIVKFNGHSISKNFCFKIIDKLGYDLDNLIIEMEKMCNFSDQIELDESSLDFILAKNQVNTSFDLAKAIFNKDLKKSLTIVENLLQDNVDPSYILNGINVYYTDLYICRYAYDNNHTANKILEEFDYKGKEFRIKNGYRDCKKNSLEYLTKCIDILMDVDLKLKTCKINSRILMEKAIIYIIKDC